MADQEEKKEQPERLTKEQILEGLTEYNPTEQKNEGPKQPTADPDALPFPEVVVLGPVKEHRGTCIWIHGLGFSTGPVWMKRFMELREANSDTSSPLHTYLHCVRFVFPTAPLRPMSYVGGKEMHGWYNVFGQGTRNDEPAPGIESSCKYIHDLVQAESQLLAETSGGGGKNVLLAGFSQGGTMTTVAGHTCPHALGGMAALSGYSCSRENYFTKANIQPHQMRTPYIIMHGDQDDVVLPAYAEETKRVMTEMRTADIEVNTGGQGQEARVIKIPLGKAPTFKMLQGLDHSVTDQQFNFIFTTYGMPTLLESGNMSKADCSE